MAASPASKTKGLGSAKHGVGHFIAERVTSIALIPLSIWAVYALIMLAPLPYEGAVTWFQHPVNTVLAVLFVGLAFYHMGLGMQVVIEDYIHRRATLAGLLLLNAAVWFAAATVAIVCICKVAFSGVHA